MSGQPPVMDAPPAQLGALKKFLDRLPFTGNVWKKAGFGIVVFTALAVAIAVNTGSLKFFASSLLREMTL